MLLVPPASAGPRPHYHVSVHLDCFNPTSYSTVLRRGESEAGQYVGEFKCVGHHDITIAFLLPICESSGWRARMSQTWSQ